MEDPQSSDNSGLTLPAEDIVGVLDNGLALRMLDDYLSNISSMESATRKG